METPIVDFVRNYAESNSLRLHMPGHKGVCRLGCEHLDLTEIHGADELFAPDGIIAQSEANASCLFGCRTIYSAEGSSLCIRAMLRLAMQYAQHHGKPPLILAARNAHRTFLTAAALLDFEILWLPPSENYLSCILEADELESFLKKCDEIPSALYVTSPDYLGNMVDIRSIAEVCHRFGMLLLVDNAHGAYLRFLPESLHPMDLGADLCCDSAHKTLPVLTGGAYLHSRDPFFAERDKAAMLLFASTSPSYLILQSLDLCNKLLAEDLPELISETAEMIKWGRIILAMTGWNPIGNEPMKITISPKSQGYTGTELAAILEEHQFFCEFSDPDYLVMMLTPDTDLKLLTDCFLTINGLPEKESITEKPPAFPLPEMVMSPREALFSETERLPVEQCTGKICAELAFSCPPAVPIVMCGERITEETLECFRYYGIQKCTVVKERSKC